MQTLYPWLKEARGKPLRRNMAISNIVAPEAALLKDKCF